MKCNQRNLAGVRWTILAGVLIMLGARLESQNTNLQFFQSSGIEIFLHAPLLFDHVVTRVDPELPPDILRFVEKPAGKIPLVVALGINADLTEDLYLQTGFDYRRLPYHQKIEVSVDQDRSFTIERSLFNEAMTLPLTGGFRLSPRWSVFIGAEVGLLRERSRGDDRFIFDRLTDPGRVPILDQLGLQQSDQETIVYRTPTLPVKGFWYWNFRPTGGMSYRLSVTSGLALDLTASLRYNLTPDDNQFKVADQYGGEDWWGDHYYLKNEGKHLEIREFLALRVVYTFDDRDRVLRKIGVK